MSATCEYPCATCSVDNFYSCLTCSDNTQLLVGTLCIYEATFYYQIATTACWILFLIPVLIRKRSLVLIKILDLIQFASYFKFIRGMAVNRQIWLYLGMRGWGDFAEGWTILSDDYPLPIWTNQEGIVNKIIRIAVIWVTVMILIVIIGFLKTIFDDKSLTFTKFMGMNLANAASFAFYITLQDMAFLSANALLYMMTDSIIQIVGLVLGLLSAIGMICYLFWCFYRINFKVEEEKYYYYKYFFLFSCDYDLFPTYNLLAIPQFSKQIKKYSNLRIIDMVRKISYSFLIVAYLADPAYSSAAYLDQVYQICAFLLFFQIIWYIVLPFDMGKEFLQFIIMILATIITFYLLFAPWYLDFALVHTIVVLVLFGLALISIILEGCLDSYKLIPIDLYDLGTKIVIEDPRLLKQIAMRRKEQEEIEKKLKKYEEQNERMRREMQEKKKSEQKPNEESSGEGQNEIDKKNVEDVREDSEMSLSHNNKTQAKQFYAPIKIEAEQYDKESMNSEELADLYKVDELKRRKVYQWNRQKPFSYSSKIQ